MKNYGQMLNLQNVEDLINLSDEDLKMWMSQLGLEEGSEKYRELLAIFQRLKAKKAGSPEK